MENTVRGVKRTAGSKLSWLIWNNLVVILIMMVTRIDALDFTRTEDELGNLDLYEVGFVANHFYSPSMICPRRVFSNSFSN